MRNDLVAALSAGVVLALAGCAPALSDEAACEEVNKYAGEVTRTVADMTESIAGPRSLALYSNRLVELSDEIVSLDIANDDIASTVDDWVAATREIGVFFSSGYEFGDDVDAILPAFDSFSIANNKMLRVCDL